MSDCDQWGYPIYDSQLDLPPEHNLGDPRETADEKEIRALRAELDALRRKHNIPSSKRDAAAHPESEEVRDE